MGKFRKKWWLCVMGKDINDAKRIGKQKSRR